MERSLRAEVLGEKETPPSIDIQIGQLQDPMSYQFEQLFATHGKTFYFASRFFPREVRPAVITLYAFFRTLDDLVDERTASWQADIVRGELDGWREWFQGGCICMAPREPLGAALAAVLAETQVPLSLFEDFLQGLYSDLELRAFTDYPMLARYCYQAAGTVGMAMAHVMGTRSEQALRAARQLGTAMQLTNILRDVGGDLANGRIYIPQDDLARFGSSPAHLAQLYKAGPDERFRELMRYEIKRARLAYAEGLHGCWLLPRACQVPILLAGRLYQRILTQIERQEYDVLRKRAATSLFTKVCEAGIVYLLASLWRCGQVELDTEGMCGDDV